MKRIDVVETKANGEKIEHTFRTNDSGCYLFVGVSSNNQISCESGFQSLRRVKAAIREYLRRSMLPDENGCYPRLKFTPSANVEWEA